MYITKWMPWPRASQRLPQTYRNEPVLALQTGIERLFDEMLGNMPWSLAPNDVPDNLSAFPRMTLEETPEEVRIEAELPGMGEDDIEITLDDGQLLIAGKTETESETEDTDKDTKRKGLARYAASFQRVIPLNWEIDRDNVEAVLDKGVLTLRLPKATPPEAESKRIAVRSA